MDCIHFYTITLPTLTRSAGRDGGADVYSLGTCAISTGYAPFGDVKPSYELRKKYEDVAEHIRNDFSLDYGMKKAALDTLLWEFIEEVVKEKEGN